MALYKNLKGAIGYLEKLKNQEELDVEFYAEHDKIHIEVRFNQPNNLSVEQLKELVEKFRFHINQENFSYSIENWNDSAMKAKTVFFKMYT